jgi:hypothetical protein
LDRPMEVWRHGMNGPAGSMVFLAYQMTLVSL